MLQFILFTNLPEDGIMNVKTCSTSLQMAFKRHITENLRQKKKGKLSFQYRIPKIAGLVNYNFLQHHFIIINKNSKAKA